MIANEVEHPALQILRSVPHLVWGDQVHLPNSTATLYIQCGICGMADTVLLFGSTYERQYPCNTNPVRLQRTDIYSGDTFARQRLLIGNSLNDEQQSDDLQSH